MLKVAVVTVTVNGMRLLLAINAQIYYYLKIIF